MTDRREGLSRWSEETNQWRTEWRKYCLQATVRTTAEILMGAVARTECPAGLLALGRLATHVADSVRRLNE